MVSILEEIKLSLGLYAFVKQNTRETYRDHGGVGMVGAAPVPDGGEGPVGVPSLAEGVVDACREPCCTKDHFQCLVSITTHKC